MVNPKKRLCCRDSIFFLEGVFIFPKGITTKILAIIPKKNEAKEMKDYPISCYKVMYKVISKILVNMLKIIFPSSIAANQSIFIKDILMMENLLLALELVRDYHND